MATSVASVVSHFPDAENGFTTTTAGSIASAAVTVPLNSVSGYTNGQPVVLVIDPTDPTKKQTFTGIVDTSGVQITSVVWTAGTNQIHALGATVVDYATATHIAMISKGIQVEHNQSGTHNAAAASTIGALLYPVGSIYINAAVATNPATLLGFGTWSAYGQGRVPVGVGTGTYVDTQAAANYNVSNIITVTSNDTFQTGMAVVLTTSGVAPTGLTAGATYYVIRLSATTISLATTRALAVAGTAIDITGTGSGNHTLTHTLTARALNDVGGEETHASTLAESPAHTHTTTLAANSTPGGNPNYYAGNNSGSHAAASSSAGSSDAHNNMQPYIAVYMWRRTA